MATAPLNPPQSQAQGTTLQDLLASLDPNILPVEPSWWPLPIGYWLSLLAIMVIIVAVWFAFAKTKTQRLLQAEISRIAQFSPEQQVLAAHQLLRWVSIHLADQPRSLNEQQFADFIIQRSGSLPPWFNSHYSNQTPTTIDWQAFRNLIKQVRQGRDL